MHRKRLFRPFWDMSYHGIPDLSAASGELGLDDLVPDRGKAMEMLAALCERLHLEGIINRPEFVHNAILYSRFFKFLNPIAEGRLSALRRDLKRLTLWQIAWGVHRGLVTEDGKGTFFQWFQSEQVWPDCEESHSYFESAAYLDVVAAVEEKSWYSVGDAALSKLLLRNSG